MKFLSKKADSPILTNGHTYRKSNPAGNARLREMLLVEQKHFCAYTEKYIDELDSCEVEHFDASIKSHDDYYNYYAVIRKANLYKKDELYEGASFFTNRFFQNQQVLNQRIQFLGDIYEEVDETDTEAVNFIDFLGLNDYSLYTQRKKHVDRLIGTFKDANYTNEEKLAYFRGHPEDLSFITAIEHKLGLDLSEFYQ